MKKEMRVLFIVYIILISSIINVYADDPFHEAETSKLRQFLMQESAVAGVLNYQQLGITSMENINWGLIGRWNTQTFHFYYLDMANKGLSGHLDLSGFVALQYVYCPFNDIKSVNLRNSAALLRADFYSNDLDDIDVTTNPLLENLRLGYNNLRTLDLSKNPDLSVLCFTNNRIQSMDLSNMEKLTEVTCMSNSLYNLRFDNCISLQKMVCDNNSLTKLNLYNLPKLKKISCIDNLLNELQLYNCGSLEDFSCNVNKISELDVSFCENLTTLNCSKNQLKKLNLEGCKRLTSLDCDNNFLSSLNMSYTPNLTTLSCKYNSLTYLTLPLPSEQFESYSYSPQNNVELTFQYNNVDLSDYYIIEGAISTFIWKNSVTLVQPLESKEGWFAFKESIIGDVLTCWVQNKTFPYVSMHFDIILTKGSMGNANPEKERFTVYSGEQSIHVETGMPVMVSVFSFQGMQLMKRKVDAGHSVIPIERGMYVVVVDDSEHYKVIVK